MHSSLGHELAPLLALGMHITAMTPCALAALCALTGGIRTVSGLQVAPRPKHIRCQRGAASPQENEGDAARAAAPLARSEDAAPTSANPFAALKKGFESAVQSATNNPDYKFGDATRSVGRGAASAINAVTGKDTCTPASFELRDMEQTSTAYAGTSSAT